jgi:hypothetical protein
MAFGDRVDETLHLAFDFAKSALRSNSPILPSLTRLGIVVVLSSRALDFQSSCRYDRM